MSAGVGLRLDCYVQVSFGRQGETPDIQGRGQGNRKAVDGHSHGHGSAVMSGESIFWGDLHGDPEKRDLIGRQGQRCVRQQGVGNPSGGNERQFLLGSVSCIDE